MMGTHFMGHGSVPAGDHQRPRPRREGPEDEQIQGQRHGPLGDRRRPGRRRPALHHGDPFGCAGHQALQAAHRGLPQLRHQAVERGPLLPAERVRHAGGLRPGWREARPEPLDARRGGARQRGDHRRPGRRPLRRGGRGALPLHLEHSVRLVRRTRQADPERGRRGGPRRDPRHRRLGAGPGDAHAAPGLALPHRRVVEPDRRVRPLALWSPHRSGLAKPPGRMGRRGRRRGDRPDHRRHQRRPLTARRASRAGHRPPATPDRGSLR